MNARERLRELIAGLSPVLEASARELEEETPQLESALSAAALGPWSRDLSAEKGAEERLDRHLREQQLVAELTAGLQELHDLLAEEVP